MTATTTVQVLVKCTQCYRIVHFTAAEQVDEDGDRYVESAPIYLGMHLHQTRGCRRRQE